MCLLDGRELYDDNPVVLGPGALPGVGCPTTDQVAAAVPGDRRRGQLPITAGFLVVHVLRLGDHICWHRAIIAWPLDTGYQVVRATGQVRCGYVSAAHLAGLEATVVTYPSGSLHETATVVHVLPGRAAGDDRLLVITDVTPFHPLDPLWPDQPADHGELRVGSRSFVVGHTVTAAQRDNGPLMVDDEIDARRDECGVLFVAAHVVDADAAPHLPVGTEVTLAVDEWRRRRLSAAHTACHLLAYALNEVTHGMWRKPTGTDSRGHHDFDDATCVSTRHDVDGSVDRYRLGRSLRKAGFDSTRFLDELPSTLDQVNQTLAQWIESDAPVRIDVTGPALTDRRQWVCEIPGGTAQMPCGGTHVRSLAEIASMTAVASYDRDAGVLEIRNQIRVVE